MKTISPELSSHLASNVTSLAVCWKLTRRDNVVLGFTSHDRDLIFESILYQASTGFTPSAIENSGSLAIDNLDVEGMLTSGSITEIDIMAGLYDFADIDIFQVNHQDLSQGKLLLKRGWLGELSIHKQQFLAEIRGMSQPFSQTIGSLYSSTCRATLGDALCKIDLATHTVTGNITSMISNQHVMDSNRSEASNIFTGGIMNFTSGLNNGLSMEVKEYVYNTGNGGQIILAMPMPYNVATNDTYSLSKGCDKTSSTCQQTFNNILNFHGEPHVPGIDRMLETAGTRSI